MGYVRPSSRAATRTCVGCRRRRAPSELVRLCVKESAILPDLSRRATGRGAHLCPQMSCLDQAIKRRSLPRAFRQPVDVERGRLAQSLEQAFLSAERALIQQPRRGSDTDVRLSWLRAGLQEFTLRIPGAMNRGPASRDEAPALISTPCGVVGANE